VPTNSDYISHGSSAEQNQNNVKGFGFCGGQSALTPSLRDALGEKEL